MYSRAASVTLGHQDRSRHTSFCRFSAINSIPSSVILEQPDRDSTVRFGKECTEEEKILLDPAWLEFQEMGSWEENEVADFDSLC